MPDDCRCVMGNDPAVSTQPRLSTPCPVHGEAAAPPETPPAPPPDPFTAIQTGWIGFVEMFRHARRAGASMVEAAILAAAIVRVNGEAGPQGGTHA